MLPTRTGSAANDMAAVMARVRKMSDSQLADILSGKDVSVPQFAAMTEAMGRKQLRQAVDGAQAQQQAKQPSVREQLLAEQQAPAAGLDALPAPNMQSMDMAGGGIIAFEDGGEVQHFQNTGRVQLDPALYTLNPNSPVLPSYQEDPERERIRKIIEEDERVRAERKQAVANIFGGKDTAANVRSGRAFANRAGADVGPPRTAMLSDKELAAAPAAPPAAPAAKEDEPKKERLRLDEPAKPDAGIAALADRKDFLGQYEGTGARMRQGIDAIKQGKQSDILLGAAEALLTSPTLAQAAGKAAGKTAQIGAAARRDEREIGKAADEYEFNLAKAREAAAQGNQDLAYKYAALADQAKYRAGILGIKGQELGMQKDMYDMVKVPAQLSKVYADATKAVKDATANRPVKPGEFQKLVDEEYRKRATSVGLGKFIDTYSPSTSLPTVSQLPKGVTSMKLPDDA